MEILRIKSKFIFFIFFKGRKICGNKTINKTKVVDKVILVLNKNKLIKYEDLQDRMGEIIISL